MGRQPKKCTKKCTKHLFSLKPVHYSAFFSRESQFSYCPQNLASQANIPIFNRDRKPYTASFILPSDKLKLVNNDQLYKMEHEKFKKQNHEQKDQILVPKPKSKSCYCNVCKEIYDDYQQHVSTYEHKKSLKMNDFTNDIMKCCQQFGNNTYKVSKVIFPHELLNSYTSAISKQTESTQINQNQKPLNFQLQEPKELFQKSEKENFEGLNFTRSIKSFHSYGENLNGKDDQIAENHLFQYSLMKEINENCFIPNCGSFKVVEQTASPIKTKFDRPIILSGKSFTLSD